MWTFAYKSFGESADQAGKRQQGKFPDTLWTCSEAAKGPWLVHPESRESPAFHLKGKTRAWTTCCSHLCWGSTEAPGGRAAKAAVCTCSRVGEQRSLQPGLCLNRAGRWKALHYNPLKECASIYQMAVHKGRKNVYPFKFQETVDAFCLEKQSNSTGKISPITL